jgi:tRNA threonylcarbamoyladenosine biosynthesis protein TsaE
MGEDGAMEGEAMDSCELLSTSVEATLAWAEALGRRLGPGSVIALDGDLGAGKTTFVRGLCEGLDVSDPVHSPSYTLMHSYAGRLEVFHFDAWMEGREAAFLDGGGVEWLFGDGVSVIEWARRVADYLPEERLEIEFLHLKAPEIDDDGHPLGDPLRGIRVLARGATYSSLIAELTSPEALPLGLRIARKADSLPPSSYSLPKKEPQDSLNQAESGPLKAPERLI